MSAPDDNNEYCGMCFEPYDENGESNCGCGEYKQWWDGLTPEQQRDEHRMMDAHVEDQMKRERNENGTA